MQRLENAVGMEFDLARIGREGTCRKRCSSGRKVRSAWRTVPINDCARLQGDRRPRTGGTLIRWPTKLTIGIKPFIPEVRTKAILLFGLLDRFPAPISGETALVRDWMNRFAQDGITWIGEQAGTRLRAQKIRSIA